MTITKSGAGIILLGIYVFAVWIRVGGPDDPRYPYFKGESGTNYRNAVAFERQGRLPERDHRFFWPEGYSPARTKPAAVEYVTGFTSRLVGLFSDMPKKRLVGLLGILLSCLCVFTFYGLARTLWQCRAAGLMAALLVGFSQPLVDLTRGTEYVHGPFALLLVSLHLWLFLAWRRKPSSSLASLSALVTLALLGSWEGGGAYAAAFGVAVLIAAGNTRTRKAFLTAHLGAVLLAAIAFPHLRAQRAIVDWQGILVLVTTAYAYVHHVLPRKVPGLVYVAAGTVSLVLLLRPLQAGGVEMLSEIEYWLYRLRFLTGKPIDPQLLPESVRFLWSHDRSTPAPYTVFAFFFPLVLLLAPAFFSFRAIHRRAEVWPVVVAAALGASCFLLDRSAVYVAALVLFPLAAVAMVGPGGHLARRGAPVAVAVILLIAGGSVATGRTANVVSRIGAGIGLPAGAADGFLSVSLGNADLDLVRYVVSRTSVKDPFLVPPDLSSLVVTFAGRKTVLVPGIPEKRLAARTREAIDGFYREEDVLYAFCKALDIRYVVYSIEFLLDTSRYSPLYQAGRRGTTEGALARKMHFFPESLRHFNLVYENDLYRLFRVTDQNEPFFLTDHPPVYQHGILEDHGDTLESFHARVLDVLTTYHTAVAAQARGDEEDAIRRFRYCLEHAPRFTKAWLGLADSLLRLRDFQGANAAYMHVLELAPDNSQALYYSALTLGHLKEVDRALGLLEVLFATGGDRELLQLGQVLKITLEKGIPLDGTAPADSTR